LHGKPAEERLLLRHRHRVEDNIKMDLMERGWESVDLIHLTQDRDKWRALVNRVMNFWIP
jgi:hypothetical protein